MAAVGVRPSNRVGIALWLAYSALAGVLQFRTGIPYTDWFTTAGNAFATAIVPLTFGGLALLAFTRWCRWDHVWRDPMRLRCTGLMRLSMIALRLVGIQWSALPPALLWPAMVAHGRGYAYPWLSMASVAAQGVFVVLGLLVYVGLYRSDRGTVVLPSLEVATK